MLIALDCVGIIGFLLLLVPTIISGILNPDNSSSISNSWAGSPVATGMVLLYAEVITIMVQDWRGAVTVRGAAKGYAFYKGQRVSTTSTYVLLYIIVPYIMLPIYLIRTSLSYRHTKQLKVHQQRHKVASLEAELGILPAIEGTCRHCKKPLVVGAEFCQYCGATVIERPKICPACAATALPDAKWCPRCRTALP